MFYGVVCRMLFKTWALLEVFAVLRIFSSQFAPTPDEGALGSGEKDTGTGRGLPVRAAAADLERDLLNVAQVPARLQRARARREQALLQGFVSGDRLLLHLSPAAECGEVQT